MAIIDPVVIGAALGLSGTLCGAILLFVSATGVARRNLLVQTVTSERAIWRRELRNAIATLAEHVMLAETPARSAAIHRQCVEIRLRLNPSRSLGHKLDQGISDDLRLLEFAVAQGREVEGLTYLRRIEDRAQKLLKQEWEVSKHEARTGKLSK